MLVTDMYMHVYIYSTGSSKTDQNHLKLNYCLSTCINKHLDYSKIKKNLNLRTRMNLDESLQK